MFVIDEVGLVLSGCFPLPGLTRFEHRFDVIEPEFGHAIVVGSVMVSGDEHSMALHEFPESRNSSADRAMDVSPITNEFLVRQVRSLRDAIYDLDHGIVLRAMQYALQTDARLRLK